MAPSFASSARRRFAATAAPLAGSGNAAIGASVGKFGVPDAADYSVAGH
jgi:hypothetical protein